MTSSPVILTIAGTDPSGGAGIQADLKTFTAHECFGTSVVTALVAQNTRGVQSVQPTSPQFVTAQMDSVLSDMKIDGLKTGMLTNVAVIDAVADSLQKYFPGDAPLPNFVIDPVTISTSGHTLLEQDAVTSLIKRLIPRAVIITPNVAEACLLLSTVHGETVSIETIPEMIAASTRLRDLGSQAVLLKGGHLVFKVEDVKSIRNPGVLVEWAEECNPNGLEILRLARGGDGHISRQLVVDVLCSGTSSALYPHTLFVRPRLETTSTHGTGCTLSAALVCELSIGKSMDSAVRSATSYTHMAIQTAPGLGHGHGPLNHMHSVHMRCLPLPTSHSPHPFVAAMVERTGPLWIKYVQHPFVLQLGAGTLPKAKFVHFIKQDYIYLKHYARAYGLLAAKSQTFAEIEAAAQIALNIARESKTLVDFCQSWGISLEELQSCPEDAATSAYARYILDVGAEGDCTKLVIAVASCLLGYGEVGLWLVKQAKDNHHGIFIERNPFQKWIEEYSGPMYQQGVRLGLETLESLVAGDPPSQQRYQQWADVWEKCVRLEIGFWDNAMSGLEE